MSRSAFDAVLAWLEGSALGVAMREWAWLYPVVEILHIVGFAVLVGAALMFDLRLLGVSRGLSADGLARHLLPWARVGLLLAAPTGLLLFLPDATSLGHNPALRAKLVAIGLGVANAAWFHRRTARTLAAWDRDAPTPLGAKVAAGVSVAAWLATVALGRLIAYV